jgi:hypothetical protein
VLHLGHASTRRSAEVAALGITHNLGAVALGRELRFLKFPLLCLKPLQGRLQLRDVVP